MVVEFEGLLLAGSVWLLQVSIARAIYSWTYTGQRGVEAMVARWRLGAVQILRNT